ncbi:hypothetical protein AHAS_Ahas08G0108200 [Arachis hypogaea]
MKKGAWTPEEDSKLIAYITRYGSWNWRQLPRSGKMWKELQIEMAQLSEAQHQTRELHSRRRRYYCYNAQEDRKQRNTRQKVKATAAATAPAAAIAAVNTTTNPNNNNNASLQYSPQTSSDTVSGPLSPQLSSTIIATNNHNENNSDYFDDIDFLNYYTQHAIENLWSETFLAEQIDNCNGGFVSLDATTTQISDSSELLSPQSSSLSSAENNDNLFTFAETTAKAFDEVFWTEHYAVDLSCVPNELLTPSVDPYVCPVAVYDDLDLWTQSNFT